MLELETRVVAMGMHVLGMKALSDDPRTNIPPSMNAPSILKKLYLYQLSNMIYEDYVSEATKGTDLMKAILIEEEVDSLRKRQSVDENGRYPCRFPNCDKTYAKDGKRRRDHEASHVPPVCVDDPVITATLPTLTRSKTICTSTTSALQGLALFVWNFTMLLKRVMVKEYSDVGSFSCCFSKAMKREVQSMPWKHFI